MAELRSSAAEALLLLRALPAGHPGSVAEAQKLQIQIELANALSHFTP